MFVMNRGLTVLQITADNTASSYSNALLGPDLHSSTVAHISDGDELSESGDALVLSRENQYIILSQI